MSEEDAQHGSIPTKSFPIMGSCEGKTMAGGVFWVSRNLQKRCSTLNNAQRPVPDDTGLNSVTTG